MPTVIGVKFKKSPKIYYFEAGALEYAEGAEVVVETARGIELGTVAMLPTDIAEDSITAPIKPVMRIATDEDLAVAARLLEKTEATKKTAAEIIGGSKLDMKFVDVEYTFDGSKLMIYFTAESRVDFRELVRELAAAFKTRIELKQIGSRDECKLKGGLGPCGRACCCNSHMSDFAHVTIKMAKNQNLSLNPGKISGLCGRLMCCLSYENEYYAEVNKRLPRLGSEVATSGGKSGTVAGVNQLKQTVTVNFGEAENYACQEFPLDEITAKPPKQQNNQSQSPKTEPNHKTATNSKTETSPKADAVTKSETSPKTEINPNTEASPKTDVDSNAETSPETDDNSQN